MIEGITPGIIWYIEATEETEPIAGQTQWVIAKSFRPPTTAAHPKTYLCARNIKIDCISYISISKPKPFSSATLDPSPCLLQ